MACNGPVAALVAAEAAIRYAVRGMIAVGLRRSIHKVVSVALLVILGMSASGCRTTPSRIVKPDGHLVAKGTNLERQWEMYLSEGNDTCLSMWIPGGPTATDACGFEIPATNQVTYAVLGPIDFDKGMILFGAFDASAENIRLIFANGHSPKIRVISKGETPYKYFVTDVPPDFNGGLTGTRLIIDGKEVIPKEEGAQ